MSFQHGNVHHKIVAKNVFNVVTKHDNISIFNMHYIYKTHNKV